MKLVPLTKELALANPCATVILGKSLAYDVSSSVEIDVLAAYAYPNHSFPVRILGRSTSSSSAIAHFDRSIEVVNSTYGGTHRAPLGGLHR